MYAASQTHFGFKVLELKVCIFWHLFTFPVARFCLILKCLAAKEITLPSPGFEPGTFSMWSQCATILSWLLHSNLAKSWEVIPIFVYIAGSQKLLEIKYPFFCFKYFNTIWKSQQHAVLMLQLRLVSSVIQTDLPVSPTTLRYKARTVFKSDVFFHFITCLSFY